MVEMQSGRSLDQVRLSQVALNAGLPIQARRLALIALDGLRGPRCDSQARSMALLVLAQAEIMESHMGSALSLGLEALKGFEIHRDLEHCAEALGVASYSAASLGLSGLSLEMANRCIELRTPLGSTRMHALGGNYLGVASFWSGDYRSAAGALDSALEAMLDSAAPHECFQPLINRCFTDMLEITHAKLEGNDVDMAPFFRRLNQCWRMALGGKVAGLSKGSMDFMMTLAVFLKAQAEVFSGNVENAQQYVEACGVRARQLPSRSWMRALKPWLDHNLARSLGDRRKAAVCARGMKQAAYAGEHQAVAELAQKMLSSRSHGWAVQ